MIKLFKNICFRCIIVLLTIACISGGLLAILNDVLSVSPEERTQRAIKKIYGEIKKYSVLLDTDNGDEIWSFKDAENEITGEISKIYVVGDQNEDSYDMLFKSKGGQGYKNGNVTVWVKVVFNKDTNPVIDKVILESYEKQTLMGKLGGEFYNGFLKDVTEAYENGEPFTATDSASDNYNPVSGATYSAQAGCNAVNCVIKCINVKGWEK